MAANYTVVETLSRAFPTASRALLGGAQLSALAASLALPSIRGLGDPTLGEAISTSRSSWVRQVRIGSARYYVKTYVYRGLVRQLRAAPRNAPFCQSRAAREAAALTWLRDHGLGAPKPVAVWEERRWWLLETALLVTEAWPGPDLGILLPTLSREQQLAVGGALGRFVGTLHRLGFRDRNLDLRNLLACARADGSFEIAKIDSGRFRLRPPGATGDRLARADWRRLLAQLEPFRLGQVVRAAAAAPAAT